MKVFPHGKGNGTEAINYVLDPKRDGREESPPEVVRGDPEIVQRVIGSTDRVWKYTSGVLSWAPEDDVLPRTEKEVMDDFERVAFAGMEPDQYSILWVRHSHAGHPELHFIIPRTELRQDKAMNPCPPNWQKQYDVWRDLWNERKEWAKPDDLKRSRLTQPGKDMHSPKGKQLNDFRKTVTDYLVQGIADGLLKDRKDLVTALQELGYAVPRQGKNYITLELPKDKKRVRLKGGIYESSWRADREIKREDGLTFSGGRASRQERIGRLERELAEICRKRTEYHHQRYGHPSSEAKEKAIQNLSVSLEAKHFGKHYIRSASSHHISLHNRILRLANSSSKRGFNANQNTNSKPEEEYKQVYSMEDQRISDRESKILGLSQRNEAGNNPDKQRPASRFIKEVDYERVESELIGESGRNGESAERKIGTARPADSRAGAKDLRAGKGGAGLPRLAERIGWCVAGVGAVVREFARRAIKKTHNKGFNMNN
ncbi:relaxase/mobilization nuclease domain-containing protein [Maridesulfovibrio ferrireducens]|uniref:relaxase/mobilization nuclease domain-containing protein n=1 Tax=Maridesulfovibrio ferrireducens TaxID=246191 RepID=UPI0026EDEC26|nr:relaxase/mobilization nuclease domain-containing protein [Maridesulfovibrio ferrireducens]